MKTLAEANRHGMRIAFYGGHPDRLKILVAAIQRQFPKVKIVEAISPPFRALSAEEDRQFTQRLIDAKPHILWVGLGCPKQEVWMSKHRMIPGVMVGVGAAFDFHAGAVSQAPHWIQKMGLEWAYRLAMEPRRLFLRYLTTNPTFLFRAALQLGRKLLFKHQYIERKTLSLDGNSQLISNISR